MECLVILTVSSVIAGLFDLIVRTWLASDFRHCYSKSNIAVQIVSTEREGDLCTRVLAYASMLVVGCGDLQESSGGSSNSSDETQILSSSAQGTQTGVLTERPWTDEPPARLTDVNGWVWNRQHKIEYDYRSYAEVWGDVNDEYIDTRKIDPEPTPSDATDYDYGYYYGTIADWINAYAGQ